MSAHPSNRLDNALRTRTPTLIYGVLALQQILTALEAATQQTLTPVDGRGEPEQRALQAAITQQAQAGGPVVVLLGTELSDDARAVLSDAVEAKEPIKIVALTSASAPSPAMAELFPLQLAATRALEGAR